MTSLDDLQKHYGTPSPLAVAKEITFLDKHARRFIELSPFLVIGSFGADGLGDVSPKGDAPGFVQVLDDKNVRRRFRASNYQSTTRVKPFICTMPMRLDEGWNQIQFNLSDFTRRAYGTNYIETLRVQIHANCRIRRIYFSDRLYTEDELPPEFKLFLPVAGKPQQM